MLSPVDRLSSVVCLSVTFVHSAQPVEIFCCFSVEFLPWPSFNIHGKFYGDRPRRTSPSGALNARGVAKYDISKAISRTRGKIGGK